MNLLLKAEISCIFLCYCFGLCTAFTWELKCTDFYLEDIWCYLGFDECCDADIPSSTGDSAPPQRPTPAGFSACSLDVTGPNKLNTNRTYLHFHYRRMKPIQDFDSNNTCMCLRGFSESVEGNFDVQFYDGNCSLSEGICPPTNLSLNCECNKLSCLCRESEYLSETDTSLQTDVPGKDNCSVPLSIVGLGAYPTHNSRTCYPTSGYRQRSCADNGDECTMTFWVFCICKRGGIIDLCDCESDPHDGDGDGDSNLQFSTHCTDTDNSTDVTPTTTENNHSDKLVEELSAASKVGIALGVILISILLVVGVFVAFLLKNRNESRNNKQSVTQELQDRDSEVRLPISNQGISNKSVHEYSSIPNNASATDQGKSQNPSTYAEPDPNIIVTPAGAISATEPAYTEPYERMGGNSVQQVYAEPNTRENQPDAGAKSSTDAYEDMQSPGNNLGSNNTHDASVPTNTSAVMESKIADKDNTEGMYSEPKDPTASNYVSPRPPYAKVDKLESSPGQPGIKQGSERDKVANAENYSHIQATLMTDDGAYQKLDRGSRWKKI